jgi:hypothetical protein
MGPLRRQGNTHVQLENLPGSDVAVNKLLVPDLALAEQTGSSLDW